MQLPRIYLSICAAKRGEEPETFSNHRFSNFLMTLKMKALLPLHINISARLRKMPLGDETRR